MRRSILDAFLTPWGGKRLFLMDNVGVLAELGRVTLLATRLALVLDQVLAGRREVGLWVVDVTLIELLVVSADVAPWLALAELGRVSCEPALAALLE